MLSRSKEGRRQYYARRKDKLKQTGFRPCTRKRCVTCKKVLGRAKFYANPTHSTGLASSCKQCTKERSARLRKRTDHRLPEEKQCSRCKVTKVASEFGKELRAPDGLQGRCKACTYILRVCSQYGISPMELYALFDSSCGACEICGRPHDRAKHSHIDHDHQTRRVRGLLCFTCNSGIGMFADDPRLLIAAAEYLLIRQKPADGCLGSSAYISCFETGSILAIFRAR